ncbi:nematoblast specific protein [Pedobacter sp. HMWF019]|uniref:DUF3472 domain-containing protein n=1 Tax=Pedobacter sp. HMWF019 TaxID=2056856 RepID=UPI000D34EA58|nr:DUF3472 domain-containing protein [Pedobacter sp. HMWF019]PTT00180.1 nematoblast specific protein [Pedobacter sp. HMWF019]
MTKTLIPALLLLFTTLGSSAQRTSVALAGNAWITHRSAENSEKITKSGLTDWKDSQTVTSIYFRVEQPGILKLSLVMTTHPEKSTFKVILGNQSVTKTISGATTDTLLIGDFKVIEKGYQQVKLQGISKTGYDFGKVNSLIVEGTPAATLSYVKDNDDNRYYWGRRGPSVHLAYTAPDNIKDHVEWFYNELMVPNDMDPVGSYFMSNGFEQGYFGMQVNGQKERRILFSVWSPFQTDNPASIPDDQKIRLLKKGDGVRSGEFGSEGSGGQSYLIYPWVAGQTYAFLTRAQPNAGSNKTVFTSWFKPEHGKWMLIASFERPNTNSSLKHLHSFLENFQPDMGNLPRTANYGNQWLADANGNWTEITEMKFTGDDIANRGYRKDFGGGSKGTTFYLKNGGFFNDSTPLQSTFSRQANQNKAPVIDLNSLP